jgi:hypothetical protein
VLTIAAVERSPARLPISPKTSKLAERAWLRLLNPLKSSVQVSRLISSRRFPQALLITFNVRQCPFNRRL